MSGTRIYIEGGGNSKDLQGRCREGFRKLLENTGFTGRMPRLVACGGRRQTYDDFRTAHENSGGAHVAMLVDSEDVVADIEKPWDHLRNRPDDKWPRPQGSNDDQVFLMVTCMETWIIADREALRRHYDALIESRLPALDKLETRKRHQVQDALANATEKCGNSYAKGRRSFQLLQKLDPAILEKHLSSFSRMKRILAGWL